MQGKITVTGPNNDVYGKKLAFKNNAPFVSCYNNTRIDNAEDLGIDMPMYNLLEYSKSYSKTTGNLWIYYRDEPNSGAEGNKNYSIKNSKSFDYKTRTTLDIPLINCEINIILTCSKNCVITSKATRDADPDSILSSCS